MSKYKKPIGWRNESWEHGQAALGRKVRFDDALFSLHAKKQVETIIDTFFDIRGSVKPSNMVESKAIGSTGYCITLQQT